MTSKDEDMQIAIQGDVLTKSRAKRRDVEISENKERGGIAFFTSQMPIDFYLKRKLISKREFYAGNKLYKDFMISGQVPGMVVNLDAVRSGGRDFTDMQMEARDRWRKAMGAVHGKISHLMLLNVCCYGKWLKDEYYNDDGSKKCVKQVNYLPYRTTQEAMSKFREALSELIAFYDLTRNSR